MKKQSRQWQRQPWVMGHEKDCDVHAMSPRSSAAHPGGWRCTPRMTSPAKCTERALAHPGPSVCMVGRNGAKILHPSIFQLDLEHSSHYLHITHRVIGDSFHFISSICPSEKHIHVGMYGSVTVHSVWVSHILNDTSAWMGTLALAGD